MILIPFATSIFIFASLAASQQSCQPGFFLATTGDCLPCPAGTSQPQEGQTACIPCYGTEIAPEEGSATCMPCGANEIANTRATQCICAEGFGREHHEDRCELCPPGTYNARSRGGRFTSCDNCHAGTFQADEGQLECIDCPSGTMSSPGAKTVQ